ncbi:peptidase C14 caspase catalytic subunit p20 [Mesorhizobium sp. M1C.F.Ca.ET.193.01.1.1]|uniref:caspase family protein n=1 Tax=unclassified Mesorhizobium TaxID=325217 RepID=UPI000FD310C1|nr:MULTISPECIES: caspase family protein [unclassified Mesorhizobium]TGS98171.1 peptidase C14 caspase catalytic subunit p20 [bacterium M00.F.Ca.ET.177.01.1.1]TGQ52726.1 peptidase C14 caspase catalytic subunit p20 [Mesorhizobium sp. M1C.F.Ca.ET.210.01.1.1]TGQ69951.1 peptidase C14 caspase catalytic subunit p20 [Mesorhizobium sp. M1C.F.Ca.ET.212.01.1.1]TGR05594.1 peptidase C14 caspase catalytic subunit p20 [Mesorhizobium sp. M1C.F.Ca.ET.204.01.1.1]TGR26187.1 peptidase C14 caspase catalytic subunit
MLRCCAFLAALILVGFTAFEAHADRRVAFVIGNSGYRDIPALKNPDKDAADVSNTFRLAGFDVFVAKDLTKLQFEEQFRNYLAAADGADLAVVYYSGHGFQIGGENFLIPVDASLKDAADIEVQAIKLDDVLQQLRSKSKIQVIILDACRNNPFPRKDYWLRDQLIAAGGAGLAQVKSSLNTLIAFATEPGAVAYDGTGDLSPFSSAFSRRALAPNQEIRTVMSAVRRDVVKATDGKQVPWENSSLIDDVVLMRRASRPALPPVLEKVVPSGVGPVALDLPEPVDVDGGVVTVSIERPPALGRLMLDGKPVATGEPIAGKDLPRLEMDVPKGSGAQEEVDMLAYATRDNWGGESQGILVFRVRNAEGAAGQQLMASLEAEQKQQVLERGLHIAGAAEAIEKRDISVPVGVGPVPLKLDFPTKDPAVSLKLASYPATGTLSLPDRTLSPDSSLMADEVDHLRYEPQIGEVKPLIVGVEIRADNTSSKQATMKLSPSVDPCDREAGEPLDLQGVVPGLLPNEISSNAVDVCRAAVKAYPDVARFRYELGRALLVVGKVEEAKKAIQEAADKGHVRAVFELGYLNATGTGMPANRKQANTFYAAASDKGDPYGMTSWGRALFNGYGVERDTTKGLDLLLKAAAMGHTYAMNDLAAIFTEGRNGVPADPARAVAFLKAGVERQDMYSMNLLGRNYLAGTGVEKDPKTALSLFQKSMDLGQPYAPGSLARMYRDGVGVQQDMAEAQRLFELATDRGDQSAAYDRAALEMQRGDKADQAVAARYLAFAAALDLRNEIPDARNTLAKFGAKAKTAALKQMRGELKSKISANGSLDDQLVKTARAVWEQANPRRDLF